MRGARVVLRRTGRLAAIGLLVGVTLALGSTAGAQDATTDLSAALQLLGVTAADADALAAASFDDGVGDTFRFAAEGSRPATLDEGYTDIVRYGAARVAWDDPPDLPCGGDLDGATVVCSGATAPLADGVALYWVEMAAPLPTDLGPLSGNVAFPTLTPGGSPWVADPAFAWDTYQGANRWLQFQNSPGGAGWQPFAQQYTGDTIEDAATGLFGVFAGNVLIAGVPLAEVGLPPVATDAGQAAGAVTTVAFVQPASSDPGLPPGWGFGTAIHVHDGTFGRDPGDTSGVDSAPDTDGSTRRGPDGLATVVGGPVVFGPPPPPEAASPSPSPATSPSPASSPVSSQPRPPEDADDGDLFLWALLVGITATTAGTTVAVRRRFCRCKVSLEVSGPAEIEFCCWELDATLEPVLFQWGDDPPDDAVAKSDPAKRHLDIDVKGERSYDVDAKEWKDWDFFDAVLEATATAQCQGGGSLDMDNATYDWDIQQGRGAITVTCTITVPVVCENGRERNPVSATAELLIRLKMGECRATVLLEQNAWGDKLYNHADILIECGSYREVFGIFPRHEDHTVLTGGDTYIDRHSGARPALDRNGHGLTSISDQIGTKYNGSKAFTLTSIDCSMCTKLRRYWEELYAKTGSLATPGLGGAPPYRLLGNNCVYNVGQGLIEAGFIPRFGVAGVIHTPAADVVVVRDGSPSVGWILDDRLTDLAGTSPEPGVTIAPPRILP